MRTLVHNETEERAGNTDLLLSVIATIEDFDAIKTDWNDLCAGAIEYCPMLSHNWLRSWWEAFCEGYELYIMLAWRDDQLVGAAPLAYQTRTTYLRRRRVITGLSNVWVDRFHFLMTAPQEPIVDLFLDHLANAAPPWDLIELHPLEESSPQTKLLAAALNERGICFGVTASHQSPELTLASDWDATLQALSSSFRQTVKRKIRKAEKAGSVEMQITTESSCIDDIMTISLESWQHDNGTSMASTDQIRNFYSQIIRGAANDGSLLVGLMSIDGEPAAFEFNLICRSKLHNFKLGFRRRYAHLSPGIVLKAFVLRSILASQSDVRLTEYDFMGTSEPYKLSWTDTIRSHCRIVVFSDSIDLRFAHWVAFQFKPFVRRSMPWLVSLLSTVKSFVKKLRE